MPRRSAGILAYRVRNQRLEVLLVHPGGPYWIGKDDGAWTIPKGEIEADEDSLAAACREFREETGFEIRGDFAPLTPIRQRSGKIVAAWAVEADDDLDPAAARSATFRMEWPPKSGQEREFPEVDRAAFFDAPAARGKIIDAQRPLIDELERRLISDGRLPEPRGGNPRPGSG